MLRGIYHHLLSMLVDAIVLVIIYILHIFNHFFYDRKNSLEP